MQSLHDRLHDTQCQISMMSSDAQTGRLDLTPAAHKLPTLGTNLADEGISLSQGPGPLSGAYLPHEAPRFCVCLS